MSTPAPTTGRKRDAIWMKFDLTEDGKNAKCKHCTWEKAPLVARMKEYFSQTHCSEDSMESFVISTTSAEKK